MRRDRVELCVMTAVLACLWVLIPVRGTWANVAYYRGPQVYRSRPQPDRERHFGHIGVTGIKVRIYKGVEVRVEETVPGTPAAGKFAPGQIIVGVNGTSLQGLNPYVTLGRALTEAEATDGMLAFDVRDSGQTRKVRIRIPVLGAYGKTWPVACEKSDKIVEAAARYYATDPTFRTSHFSEKGIGGALACLFLMSTGDDAHLPWVRSYLAQFLTNVDGIGSHTWNNGYNGIACAEYYLRTGDRSVLPILQYYCDDARDRQKFEGGWTHWGFGIGPGYVQSGLMNPAGAQVLTTLLLAKECGAKVDEATLLGALRFFYRFAGHGTVPYGDHRAEGGLGSNGKDGMVAAAMQVASGARGDVGIYNRARDYLSFSTLTSYPVLVQGHGDEGRGDGMWRGVASSYLRDDRPDLYQESMHRLRWWYDLSRRPGGGFGVGTCQRFDDLGSGAGVALSYTAPRKTLRITGAPRAKHAEQFTLPKELWGRPADLAFLSINNGPATAQYGKPDPIHVPYYALGGAYHSPTGDLKAMPLSELLKNVHHARYMIRAQAAKGLRVVGAIAELETLLRDGDPRVRRAALDGIIDYNYWFGMGRNALAKDAMTPAICAALKRMLADPGEALYVVDGALMAMKLAPPEFIAQNLALIKPWTRHEEWWLRESAFMALSGMAADTTLRGVVLPTMIDMLVAEYHTAPRSKFTRGLAELLSNPEQTTAKQVADGFLRAVRDGKIIPGERAGEGSHNVATAAAACLEKVPALALPVAEALRAHLPVMATEHLLYVVGAPSSSEEGKSARLYGALSRLDDVQRERMTDFLHGDCRRELKGRMKPGEFNRQVIDAVLELTQLRQAVAGWKAIGAPEPAMRVWRFTSFDPPADQTLHPREKKRFRNVSLPAPLENWMMPEYDDSAWSQGRAPVGVGTFTRRDVCFTNASAWGDGEFLVMRTMFDVESLDADLYRLSILAKQGFDVYLNGQKISTYIWWKDMPHYRPVMLSDEASALLKKGRNVLAVYCNVGYDQGSVAGQMDLRIEGLKLSDL